jgi:hypothetical protein
MAQPFKNKNTFDIIFNEVRMEDEHLLEPEKKWKYSNRKK